MSIGVSANRLELLQIARAVAAEKSIDESIVIEAIERLKHPVTVAGRNATHSTIAK